MDCGMGKYVFPFNINVKVVCARVTAEGKVVGTIESTSVMSVKK